MGATTTTNAAEITREAAAVRAGVSICTINRWLMAGKIASRIDCRNRRLVSLSSLEEFIATGVAAPAPTAIPTRKAP